MPEGPTVKRFSLLASPFVNQQVVKVGGSTKQILIQDLQGQQFQACQVHGKNLYLKFGFCKEPVAEKATDRKDGEIGETSRDCVLSPADEDNTGIHMGRWLRFHFGLYGSIRSNEFARAKQANKRGDWKDPTPRLAMFLTDLVSWSFQLLMTWCSSPASDPRDILSPEFDKEQAVRALSFPRPVSFTLMDQKNFSGLGFVTGKKSNVKCNIIKNEILYLAQIHPLSIGSFLPLEKLRVLVDLALSFTSNWLSHKLKKKGLHYHTLHEGILQ
ncbi:hypothetical protein GDO86_010584 [Hymenochirus boettgeri]|uniref:DNA-(apurinic or apyrimidinic site) lyase n=1 Tax=Hymenochirus boettgeri TaxID=247094 RepID=A0A8T2JL12_9PIPI|nr:hypothetical protein GDO86_010584 [Hymenochirus boettgeri]